MIEYPIEVIGIDFGPKPVYSDKPLFSPKIVGKFVSVRPCDPEYDNKTYLGLYIGDIALTNCITYHKATKRLEVLNGMFNPAIFVFDLNKVIFGCGSWWGEIKSEEQLRQITDTDIDNVWYVKALKQLNANKGEDTHETEI